MYSTKITKTFEMTVHDAPLQDIRSQKKKKADTNIVLTVVEIVL